MSKVLVATCLVVFLAQSGFSLDRAHRLAKKAKTVETNTCEGVTDSESCHSSYAEGCTNSTKPNTYDPFLAYLKNTTSFPKTLTTVATLTKLSDFQKFDSEGGALNV